MTAADWDTMLECDFLLGIKLDSWPSSAAAWPGRSRCWPEQEVIFTPSIVSWPCVHLPTIITFAMSQNLSRPRHHLYSGPMIKRRAKVGSKNL